MKGPGCAALLVMASLLPELCRPQWPPPTLRDGSGKFRGSGYLQVRYTGLDEGQDQFALRRLKLMLGGELNRDWQW